VSPTGERRRHGSAAARLVHDEEVNRDGAVNSARGVTHAPHRRMDGVAGVYLLALAWLLAGIELTLVVVYATGHLR
jgi:hypothetical protein